ncbi:Protein translocase subunit SecY [subsurface metagenome]
MFFLSQIKAFFFFKDLRTKLLYTVLLLIVVRVLAHIPLPGVDVEALRKFFADNQIFGLLNIFSGGTMQNFSIILMGVAPYITASIVMQLLTMVIPSLEALSKEGEYGYQKINQYTRYLTVPLAIIQSYGMILFLTRGVGGQQPVLTSGELVGANLLIALITVTAGTMLLMWIGEVISEEGIGNGISLIITLGIIAGIPQIIRNTAALIFTGGVVDWGKAVSLIVFIIIAILIVGFIILVNEGQRKIPVSYARRIRGSRVSGGVDTHIPLRVNQGGVIPIIFALSIVLFPSTLARFLEGAKSAWLSQFAQKMSTFFSNDWVYGSLYFILVILFTYFYTAIIFNPEKVSDNLQKQGGFIPGIRPGTETKNYLSKVLNRINLPGGLFLAFIAVLPFIIQAITKIPTLVIGGTGILIVVSVVLDTTRQIKSQLLMRSYRY